MARVIFRVGPSATAHELALLIERLDGEHESWADPRDVTVLDPEGMERDQARAVVSVRALELDEARERALVQLLSAVVHGGRRILVAGSQRA